MPLCTESEGNEALLLFVIQKEKEVIYQNDAKH